MENLIEYLLSLIDYTYLLYFFCKLSGIRLNLKKCLLWLPVMAFIQYLSEFWDVHTLFTSIKDLTLIAIFLLAYSKDFTRKNILQACIINVLLILCINTGVSSLYFLSISTGNVLNFGIQRVVFALMLKVFTCIVMYFVVKFLIRLELQVDSKINSIISSCLVFLALALSFVLQLSKSDMNTSSFTLILIVITGFLFYLFAQYNIVIKEKLDNEIMQNIIEMNDKHIKELNEEFKETRKIRHEIKNQFLICHKLLEQKKYEELQELLGTFIQTYDHSQSIALCKNIYVDTLLNQKINQYSNIKFHLRIELSDDFSMKSADLVSLLSNLIDNACEELNRIDKNEFTLTIRGNGSELSIHEQNACLANPSLISKKAGKGHGYGLEIIKDIVNKYDGQIVQEKADLFTCNIILFFEIPSSLI